MLLNRWGEVEPSPKRIFVLFSRLTILNFKSVQILNRYLYDWTTKTGQAIWAFLQTKLVYQTTTVNFHFKSCHWKSTAPLQHGNHDEQIASDSNFAMHTTSMIEITRNITLHLRVFQWKSGLKLCSYWTTSNSMPSTRTSWNISIHLNTVEPFQDHTLQYDSDSWPFLGPFYHNIPTHGRLLPVN